jgi:hypothetical protein
MLLTVPINKVAVDFHEDIRRRIPLQHYFLLGLSTCGTQQDDQARGSASTKQHTGAVTSFYFGQPLLGATARAEPEQGRSA